MVIQIDSREKARAIKKIVEEFDRKGIKHPVSKLMVGDYMNYDNPRLIIDRKQNDFGENCCLRRRMEFRLFFLWSMGMESSDWNMLYFGRIPGGGSAGEIRKPDCMRP